MKTLLIGDLHLDVDWVDRFLSKQSYDRVVFLGDYFDDFSDSVEENEHAALWLKKNLRNPKFVFLFGNHDIHYASSAKKYRGSGYSDEKRDAINAILTTEDWLLLQPYIEIEGYFLSHAGVLQHAVKRDADQPRHLRAYFVQYKNAVLKGRWDKELHSLVWRKWHHFEPVAGFNQIVGHTQRNDIEGLVLFKDASGKDPKYSQIEKAYGKDGVCCGSFNADLLPVVVSRNWLMDTHNKYVGYIKNGKVKFVKPKPTAPAPRPIPKEIIEKHEQARVMQFMRYLDLVGDAKF